MSLEGALGFYDPVVRTVQGAHSKTFTRPPLDTTLTIPELFKFHAEHSAEHAVFAYADDEHRPHYLYYPEVYRAIRKAATFVYPLIRADLEDAAGKGSGEQPVIAILANTGASPPAQPPLSPSPRTRR